MEPWSFLRRRYAQFACMAVAAVLLVWVVDAARVSATTEIEQAHAKRAAYDAKVAGSFDDHFGQGKHFLPSLMTTDTGQFIDPKEFPTAQYCGHCHREAHHEWRESAHSNANRAPWYLKNVDLLKAQKGVEYTRHCEGCHDPVAMVAGTLTSGSEKRRPFDADGVTCMVCHSIQAADTRGTGSYVLAAPAVLVDADGQRITRPVSDAEILAHLDRHSAAVMRPLYKTSEFCAACHKAALPMQLNDYKWQRAISLYDEWQNSSFAKQSPLPFYEKPVVSTCNTCHMMRENISMPEPGAKNGQLASHRWLGGNSMVPQFYKYSDQAEHLLRFLQSGFLNVDLFALERGDGNAEGPVLAPLGRVPFAVRAGELLTADVVIQNKGIAHSLIPEQRDFYEAWVDFSVKSATGKVLFESGFLNPKDDTLDETAHSFTNRLVNARGGLNREHQVWDTRIVAYNNTIQSGRSQLVRYSFHMPAAAEGPVTLTATVKYRRFNQHFADFGTGKTGSEHYQQPVAEMASVSRTLRVGQNEAVAPLKDENPVWMRWNNYGIALLDAQQYGASRNAFARVAELRPDYADAYTNQAVAEFQWQKFEDAAGHLKQALRVAPGNARALYYRALVERNLGEPDEAIADLKQVVAAFPRSRDAHRELGFSYYQQHNYAAACDEYRAVQSIDPDDLAAHYLLAVLYRRLGEKDKAAVESKAFADQKDDPSANAYALEYLQAHPETASESVAWHTHSLDTKSNHADGPLPTSFSATQN